MIPMEAASTLAGVADRFVPFGFSGLGVQVIPLALVRAAKAALYGPTAAALPGFAQV
jgi:hypothetical protein